MSSRFHHITASLITFVFCTSLHPQSDDSAKAAQSASSPLKRYYTPGETMRYEMKGSNRGWEYQIQADATVKIDAQKLFFEEIGWSNLRSNAPMTLSPTSLEFRQDLSLTSPKYLSVPDLSKVQPFVIGPITDLLTFYADVFLANNLALTHAGQKAYFARGTPNSWADGQHITLGQDSIDFDLTLEALDQPSKTATLLIRHVPPPHPQITLPTEWMKVRVGKGENNWVEVEKSDGKYLAQVGEETFDVHIKLDTFDGKILSAELHNPVSFTARTCQDAALLNCDTATAGTLVRDVTLHLVK
jgi:hypothetical protein